MHRNVCWHLPERELYSHVDVEKKAVEGFDPLVLKALIKFYLIEPTASKIENDGYLGEKKHLHNVKNDYNRQYLHSAVRMMYSKRPRHLMRPDIEPYQRLHYQLVLRSRNLNCCCQLSEQLLLVCESLLHVLLRLFHFLQETAKKSNN